MKQQKLLVVNTPKGHFQYTRLPYGVSTAPAIFHSVMDHILYGLPVACYLDNILIATKTKEEHDKLLEQTLEKLAKAGVSLRHKKCDFIPLNYSIWLTALTVWEYTQLKRMYK